MKTLKHVLIVLVVIVLGYVVINSKPKEAAQPITAAPATTEEDCYIWNTEAGDSATLRMVYPKNGELSVSGSFNWLPAEKDKKVGTFTGAFDDEGSDGVGWATVWWKSNVEGVEVVEELRIATSAVDNQAVVGFGEMKDRGDGVYIYANPEKISYAPYLTLTDCADEAVR